MNCPLCSKAGHPGPCYVPLDFGDNKEIMNGDIPVEQVAPPTPDEDGFKTILIRKDDLRFLYQCALAYTRGGILLPSPETERQLKSITYRLV